MFKEIYRQGYRLASETVFPDPETRHNLTIEALNRIENNLLLLKILELYFSEGRGRFTDPVLRTELANGELILENPVMIGAGVDKNGRVVWALWAIGASAVETGAITYYGQRGNKRPRLYIPIPGSAINAFGFNNDGVFNRENPRRNAVDNLSRYEKDKVIIGVNVGINKLVLEDSSKEAWPRFYAYVIDHLYDLADYFVINVSSPNTEGLRKLQDKEYLIDIVQAAQATMDRRGRRKPLYIKLSPDITLTAVDDVIAIVKDNRLAGIISVNTTVDRDIKASFGPQWAGIPGGVSGNHPEYIKLARGQLSHIFTQTNGSIDTIGVGGIDDFESGLQRIIEDGASAIQVVTCLTQAKPGPFFPNDFNRKFANWLRKQGVTNISQVRGAEPRKASVLK